MSSDFFGRFQALANDGWDVRCRDAGVPHIIRKHHDIRALRAAVLAAALGDADGSGQAVCLHVGFQLVTQRLAVTPAAARAVVAKIRADEQDLLIGNRCLAHAAL